MKRFEVYYVSGNYESESLEGETLEEVETDVVNFHMDDIESLYNGDVEEWKKETGLEITEQFNVASCEKSERTIIDVDAEEVRSFNHKFQRWESCDFDQAGIDGIKIMSEIVEYLTDKWCDRTLEIYFLMHLCDVENNNADRLVEMENGQITVYDDDMNDITENYNIEGWTQEDGEYTIY